MRPVRGKAAAAALCTVISLAVASSASAQVEPYRANDYGGFRDVLPPGTNGLDNVTQLGAFELNGSRPPHNDDQYAMYQNLVYAAPNLRAQDLGDYFKDASFGVTPGQVESSVSPRSDVTILRDKGFGVPHVYGSTRAGVMFGAGYAAAQDRLFFIDVLRHLGHAQLSSFIGGSEAGMDAAQLEVAPYDQGEFQQQADNLPVLYGAEGQQVLDDANDFVAGINEYINEAKLDPSKMPGEYAAIGQPLGPQPWTAGDLVAEASLIGGIFGQGGGTQLAWGQILQSFQSRFGSRLGSELWRDWREPEDPEAPVTVHKGSFPYQTVPKHPASASVALPDPGSYRAATESSPPSRAPGVPTGLPSLPGLPGLPAAVAHAPGRLLKFPTSDSNALLVSASHSASGHPLAVMGPQVGYFAPQILMEEDLHGPGVDAAGAAFSGVNLYVELGRGQDYAWSATSAGQDIVDDFAVDLCNPDGSPPTSASDYYLSGGACVPMQSISRTNSWTPNGADQTPPGSQTITVQRTDFGSVLGRGTVHGRPVAFTQLRSTFGHEIDSALGFRDFNDPGSIHNARDFQRAAYKIGYTFNWFYADNRDIAYFNSGANPVRDPRTDPLLPVSASYPWRGFNPSNRTADYTPASQHPQALNQSYLTSWNNKQAHGYEASDGYYGTVYRSQLLDDRVRAGLAHGHKLTLTGLVNAMEDAGTVDLRADKDLPYVLDVIGTPSDPRLAAAVRELRAWVASGSHRRAPSPSAPYDHAQAIAILDAWFPLLVKGEFEPALGSDLYGMLTNEINVDNDPNNSGQHLGSAYDNGWYGYVQKDLRDLLARAAKSKKHHPRRRRRRPAPVFTARAKRAVTLGPPVLQPYHRVYCGGGSLSACRAMLLQTLSQALAIPQSQTYSDQQCQSEGNPGGIQKCFDSILFRPLGAVTQPLMAWVNRPTFQQADEIQGHRPR